MNLEFHYHPSHLARRARQHQQHKLVRDSCMVPSDRQDQGETTKTRNYGAKYGEIRDYKLMALETFNLSSLSLKFTSEH